MSNVTTTVRASIKLPTTPTIYNLSMPLANTEYSQALSNGVKKFTLKTRDRTANMRVAFVTGGTTTSWIEVKAGCVFSEENLDFSNGTIYVQTDKVGQILEILEWA